MAILNQIKTVVLLGVLSAVLIGVGSLFGANGLTIGLIIALIMNVGSYFFSDKLVLAMYRAKEVSKKDYHELYQSVEEVSRNAGIPMPKVYIIPSEAANAFATGRNPKHAVVACTEGIMKLLNKHELKAVIAHEIGHVKNRDILIATIAATIASVISYAASIVRFGAMFGGINDRDRNGNSALQLLVLAILAPLTATIIQLAISRSREYIADETSGKLTHRPQDLASALEKISGSVRENPLRMGGTTTASLFIINPFSAKGFVTLFSTHPPVEERVKRLRSMRV